jgi:hypothetical protein
MPCIGASYSYRHCARCLANGLLSTDWPTGNMFGRRRKLLLAAACRWLTETQLAG